MNNFKINETGGRGTSNMQYYVNSILTRYKHYMGSFEPPIKSKVLAWLQNAEITYRHGTDYWISSLMPMSNGFIINVNKDLSLNRKRNAICHEIAHTFFFDINSKPPKRINKPRPDNYEELLCFWAAREMLVPSSICAKMLINNGLERAYSFKGISELAKSFLVSPDLMARRLTHDLALLGNDWIVLWYLKDKTGTKIEPKSLYPKKISSLISQYMKSEILKALYDIVSECSIFQDRLQKEIVVGKRKKHRLKICVERVNRIGLGYITWVSPIEI